MECDHLLLGELDRRLISRASGNSKRVYLAPMDKGLSGSSVWQARWRLNDGPLSKLHVFKIGPISKLQIEDEAIAEIASAIDLNFPHTRLYSEEGQSRGLLRQQFAGDVDGDVSGSTISLRNYIRKPEYGADPDSVRDVVERLYSRRMKAWHYDWDSLVVDQTIADAVPWWPDKIDLEKVAHSIGYQSLNEEISSRHGVTIAEMASRVTRILNQPRSMSVGPVHGDLHAMNVNLDAALDVHLIDFGNTRYTWRAIDFVILEAAIKFAAAPVHAPLSGLLDCERLIDQGEKPESISEGTLYGSELRKILSACVAVRRHCRESKAETNFDNYRAGLISVCSAFTSIEWLLNRRFLFHSIAYHLNRLSHE